MGFRISFDGMIADLHQLIAKKKLSLEYKEPYFVTVANEQEGFLLAKDVLYELVNKRCLLLLSGGRTPKSLYNMLSKEEKLEVGAAGLIDERYGKKFHENSNEQLIQQSGLMGYLRYKKAPFYPILSENPGLEDAADTYDQTLRLLLRNFQSSVGILGIGLDGHTAGIPIQHTQRADENSAVVTYYTDFPLPHQYRISMTFLGLSMLDTLLVLVFGDDKKKALLKMMQEGPEIDIPARFFKRTDIAKKTLIITDQKV